MDLSDDPGVRAAHAARTSHGRLLALLAAPTGDIPTAEDALADAYERALLAWPRGGVPANPDAWLLTVARNRMRDHWKSAAVRTGVPLDPELHAPAILETPDIDAVGDRRLELMLACAHPAIDHTVRTPLMLNTVLGLTAARIATAFALPTPTLAARLVRAKKRIRTAGIPFRIPERDALPPRIDHVLEAVYGAHAVDWEIGGTEPRTGLAAEALDLAEILARLAPGHAETHGLAALIALSSARAPARLDREGRLVPLYEQDTSRWDRALIERGRAHLRSAHSLGTVGRFQLEAAAHAVHCARADTGTVAWDRLRELYRHLHRLAPTLGAVTALAAVTAETDGPAAGLAVLDELAPREADRAARFAPAWAVRAHLLCRLGHPEEARTAYERAISLTTDPAARAHLAAELSELR
ncbi:RNA polymerase sigma factor [Nocardiopsis nanhaiensis]